MHTIFDVNERDLSEFLSVKDENGHPGVMIGLLATVFLERPWTREVREAVTDVAEGYIAQVREHLRWVQHPRTRKMHPIHSRRVPFPREWLAQHEDGKTWEFTVHGGEGPKAASAFQVCGLGASDIRKDDIGYLHVSLPLTWFAGRPGSFPDFVLRFCERLRPLSGYGGLGVLESPDNSVQNEFQPVVRLIAERFPGLEIEGRPETSIHVNEGIKGVNWLTILGERWIKEMGGLDALRASLDESFVFHPYEGGVIIQAGPKPQIGDVKANRWPSQYVALAKVLKKIQIKNHYPFHFGGPGRMDHEASKAWVFRFDGK